MRILTERLGNLRRLVAVQIGLGHLPATVVVLAGERDEGLVGTPVLLQVVADGVEGAGSRARSRS